jgi:trigger factor
METNIEEISQVKRRIDVEIEAEEVNKKLDQAYRELSKNVKVKGFRPGKVPRRILEQYYSKHILSDVKSDLIEESFSKVIEENKLFPLGKPSLEDEAIRPGESFRYTIHMEVRPDFELKDYMGISVEKEILNVSEDDVDKKLEGIREAHADLTSITENREIRDGDYVIIDYEGFWNEKPLKGIKGQDSLIHVGSKNFYPEVESGIVGLKKAAGKNIEIDFKEDFHDKRLAGKRLTFAITIKDIKKKELPELNDDFAKGLGSDIESFSDLRMRVREDITLQEERRIDRELKKRLLKKIADSVDFELPEVAVENEIERSIATIKQNFLLRGVQFESAGISEEKMREDFRKGAEEKVKEDLVLSKIANLESISIEEHEIREGFQKLAAQTGKDMATLHRYYEENDLVDSFRNQLLVEKVLNHCVQGAKINRVEKIPRESQKDRKEP